MQCVRQGGSSDLRLNPHLSIIWISKWRQCNVRCKLRIACLTVFPLALWLGWSKSWALLFHWRGWCCDSMYSCQTGCCLGLGDHLQSHNYLILPPLPVETLSWIMWVMRWWVQLYCMCTWYSFALDILSELVNVISCTQHLGQPSSARWCENVFEQIVTLEFLVSISILSGFEMLAFKDFKVNGLPADKTC